MRARGAAALLLLALAAGCSSGSEPEPGSGSSPTPSTASPNVPSAAPSAASSTPAEQVREPQDRACYRMTYDEAVAPTTSTDPVPCSGRHTSMTYAVGRVDAVVGGHLLAVDSDRVQQQVAEECPQRLQGFLGGDRQDLRLSMLRSVWFTPTVEESDAGADWYRCDVVALAGAEQLAPLTGRLAGALDRPEAADRWAMCGTAGPDAPRFRRVPCSAEHSWRAVSVIDLGPGRYPGEARVRDAGQGPCEAAGRDAADDPLSFEWGYEWPSADQWRNGMTFGRCWAPD
ncbi:septum formation family protein [Nocardioides abyssi]|uniref:Septum formation family protein n=1 Tax=Nocardioides abyssi TaxID=3058370 RepID=A0ABT8EXH5_9ACTN|nr:septum formation family protein [Nocardioides abyssi]MDN4162885.1 septum formation family protein [Nocardioides abyssi]